MKMRVFRFEELIVPLVQFYEFVVSLRRGQGRPATCAGQIVRGRPDCPSAGYFLSETAFASFNSLSAATGA